MLDVEEMYSVIPSLPYEVRSKIVALAAQSEAEVEGWSIAAHDGKVLLCSGGRRVLLSEGSEVHILNEGGEDSHHRRL